MVPNCFQIVILTRGIIALAFGSGYKLPTGQNNNLEAACKVPLLGDYCEYSPCPPNIVCRPSDAFNISTGLYQQSVTLTARMWPPTELQAGSPKIIFGLPVVILCIIIGFIIIVLILGTLLLCCWLLPKRRKILSPSRYSTSTTVNIVGRKELIMAHHHHSSKEQNYVILPKNVGMIPPQYSAPPVPCQISQYPSHSLYAMCSNENGSRQNIPETHKSMWAINPLCASNGALNETDSTYRTRSLPAWGKGSKQRPVSTTDDIEELYAKITNTIANCQVNFSKKRKNRMRNGEAAIIALCRSRSQNLQGLPLEREGIVIYDERTAL